MAKWCVKCCIDSMQSSTIVNLEEVQDNMIDI